MERERKRKLATVALAIAALTSCLGGVAMAQSTETPQPIEDNASYYDNENGSTNTTEWVPGDGNATAVHILEMLSRTPGIFIGTGEVDPSGSGFEGVLLTGLIIGGSALFAVAGIGIGAVAGSMIGMVLAFGLTTIGIIPLWIQPLLLFTLVGVPASAAVLRVFRR